MKIFSRAILLLIFFLIFAGWTTTHTFVFGASWSQEKSHAEDARWKVEISKFNVATDLWIEKREELQKIMYYGDGSYFTRPENVKEYCSEKGCWYLDDCAFFDTYLSSCTYTPTFNTSLISEFNIDKTTAKWHYDNGDIWDNSHGQSMELHTSGKMYWESHNFGQTLLYVNKQGDSWESVNFGQVVTYIGADGEKWQSTNYGQSIEHFDPQTGEEETGYGSDARNLRGTESTSQDAWR